jgi:formate hydrogenlyase transcriptional activator
VLSRGETLTIGEDVLPRSQSDLPSRTYPSVPASSLEEFERGHILAALGKAGWVIEGPKGAAAILDLHPNTLRSRLKKMGIRRPA